MFFNRDHKTCATTKAGRIFLAGFLSILLVGSTVAQNPRNVPDVTNMSVEDLMNLQVTSVSKRTQKVADAAAAIFVITQEDIRRSGATSIPEALRLVPGLEVARIDQNKWAIGSRGFNGRFDNKLLVLIDGRSVYTPLFSGVYWREGERRSEPPAEFVMAANWETTPTTERIQSISIGRPQHSHRV